ncbi:EamA family transporter, partial [Acidobacteria bacterium AH-259-G07]|nr:EamA family transporter [Acidobacteria bacterium AH-259-G07]
MLLPKWSLYAFLSVFWWGVYGLLAKIGSVNTSPSQMQILFTVGTFLLVVPALMRTGVKVDGDRVGITYATLIGLLAGLGNLAYFAALETGKASVVGTLTSIYPVLTVSLAV